MPKGIYPHKRMPLSKRKVAIIHCAVCGKETTKPLCWLKKVQTPTCSHKCNGILRGREWATHAHKGRAAWTPANEASFRQKMSGHRNPAWKGGVTLKRPKGNYQSVVYVRCPPEMSEMGRKDGYIMEHRMVMARRLGRMLSRTETVHHLNHDPLDNRLENLELWPDNRSHKMSEGGHCAIGAACRLMMESGPGTATACKP